VDETILNEINALAAGGATAEDVADQIQKKSRISADLIKYLARAKITV
jgi:hypothetical protein